MNNKQEEFLATLRGQQDNRGLMAELRCLLNKNLRMRGWAAIARLGRIGHRPTETISGLFAYYPQPFYENVIPFGRSCRQLANIRKKSAEGADDAHSPLDVRVRRLLACDSKESICSLLPDLVRGMKNENVRIDYDTLFRDLIFWDDSIREKWARDYWSAARKEDDNVSDGN